MNDNRSLMKHFSVMGFGSLFSIIIGFLNTPIITRLVDPLEYGQYNTFLTYTSVIINIIYLGLDQGLIRYFYENTSLEYRRGLLYKTVRLPIVIYSVLLILTLSTIFLFKITITDFTLLSLSILYILVMLIERFTMLVLRLQYKTKKYSLLNVLKKVLYIVFVLSIIFIMNKSTSYVLIVSILLSELFITLLSVYWEKDLWNFSLNMDKNIISTKRLFEYSLPFLFTMLITSLFDANDKIFLQKFSDFYVIGIFSSAQSLVAMVSIIQNTFNTVWAPAQIEHYTNNPEDKDFFIQINDLITVLMFTIAMILVLFKDVIAYFLGESYREAAFFLPTLLFGPVLMTISETTVGGIVFKEKSYFHLIISISVYIVDLVTNLMLVPILGAAGAAISTAISYIIYFYLRTLISKRLYPVNFNIKKISLIIFTFLLYSIYATYHYFDIIILLGFIANVLLVFLLYKKTIIANVKKIFKLIETTVRR